MTNYITVTWATEAPVTAGEGWSNVLFICSGSVPAGEENPFIITSSTYSDLLTIDTLPYQAAASYFSQFVGSPTNTSYMYMLQESGDAQTGSLLYSGIPSYYETPYKPVSSIDRVFINLNNGEGSGYQELDSGTLLGDEETGFFLQTGVAGNYDGVVYFSTGNGVTGGGPAYSTGGSIVTGNGVVPNGSTFLCYYSEDSWSNCSRNISDFDVQIVVPVHNVLDSGGILDTATGAEKDFAKTLDMIAGQRKIAVFAVPKYESLTGMDNGNGWEYLRDYIGQNMRAAVIYADVNVDGSLPADDPASVYAGQIAITHPHTTLGFAVPTISTASRASKQDQLRWKEAQIACIFRESDLGFTSDQISFGFSFSGTSPSNRINNVRCKFITEFNIRSDLHTLLSARNVRMTPQGMGTIKSAINRTLNRLQSQLVIDDGPRIIEIPDPDATSRLTRRVSSVKIRWTWNTTMEGIDIVEFGELV